MQDKGITRNGWNLEQFSETVKAVQENPEAGKLKFRARFEWDRHFAGDARTDSIEQMGQTIPRKFTLRGDHPPELLGENTGATAVETLLCALGSCIAGTFAAHATANEVDISGLEVELEGGIDLSGFLRLAEVPAGLDGVRVKIRVRSEATEAKLQELLDLTSKASPVFDSLSRPVRIEPRLERI